MILIVPSEASECSSSHRDSPLDIAWDPGTQGTSRCSKASLCAVGEGSTSCFSGAPARHCVVCRDDLGQRGVCVSPAEPQLSDVTRQWPVLVKFYCALAARDEMM